MTIAFAQTSARYHPVAQIGRGGMAEIILTEMQVGRGVTNLVVLKRLWPELADDPELANMFLREARLCVRMNHPNVVRAYEIVEDAAGSAIAMEYLEGQPLARVLNRLVGAGTLELATRLRVLIDVLGALDYAHELCDYDGTSNGVVHRDVNPQNVFVTYEGGVKLLDFGVAKSARDAYQTHPGALRGKLAYLSPEQALGGEVDRRADVFSVGVMLWEMLTGRRMWQSMTEASIMRHLTTGTIPALPRNAAVPAGLAGACARALSRAPEGRFATAGEFAAALLRLLPPGEEAGSRHLGRVVGLAFAPERAARRTLIEEHLRRARSARRDVDVGRWTIPPGAADAEILPVSLDRPTPNGPWTLGGLNSEEPVELSPEDLIEEAASFDPAPPPPAPARGAAPSSDSRTPGGNTRLHRVGWLAAGFAVAAALGGVSYAARSTGERPVVRTPAAAQAASSAPRPAPLVVPASTPAAIVVPSLAAEADAAPFGWVTRGNRRHARPAPVAEKTAEASRGGSRERGTSTSRLPARVSRPQSDDDVLEPTPDLGDFGRVPSAPARGTGVGGVAVRPAPASTPRSMPGGGRAPMRAIDVADPFAP